MRRTVNTFRQGNRLKATVNIDDSLLEQAQRLTGLKSRSALIRERMRALVERENAGGWRVSAEVSRNWNRSRAGRFA